MALPFILCSAVLKQQSSTMKIKLSCISMEIKLKIKAKLFRKREKVASDSSNETTFETFDEFIDDPWMCCQGSKDDINYSCLFEGHGREVSVDGNLKDGDYHNYLNDQVLNNDQKVVDADDDDAVKGEFLDVTEVKWPLPGPNQCLTCYQYWRIDTEMLLVETTHG